MAGDPLVLNQGEERLSYVELVEEHAEHDADICG